jgi:hypothetical protein
LPNRHWCLIRTPSLPALGDLSRARDARIAERWCTAGEEERDVAAVYAIGSISPTRQVLSKNGGSGL